MSSSSSSSAAGNEGDSGPQRAVPRPDRPQHQVLVDDALAGKVPSECQTLRRQYKVLATDVDGTLLSSHHSLREETAAALQRAITAGMEVIIVTGKARGPWLKEVHEKLPQLRSPAVFLQGLLVCDAAGRVLHSASLPRAVVLRIISFAKRCDVSIALYCRDELFVAEDNACVDKLKPFKEPTPKAVGDLEAFYLSAAEGKSASGATQEGQRLDVNKIVFLIETAQQASALRPDIDELIGTDGKVTQALDWAIEVLPANYNKAVGLRLALNTLNDGGAESRRRPLMMEDVVAFGDGENDIEMVQAVGLGCAMGNAMESLKKVAKAVVPSNDNDGIAHGVAAFCEL